MTGASSGIGRQCAIDCSKMGAIVVLIARDEERLKETIAQMEYPERHCYYSIDLSDIDQIRLLVDNIVSANGKIDLCSCGRNRKNFAIEIFIFG